MNLEGFIIQRSQREFKEAMAVSLVCSLKKIPFKLDNNYKNMPKNWVCVGDVKWVEKIFGRHITPNYYPDFLKSYLNRNVWQTNEWPLGKKVFIKPADHYKRFTGFVTNGGYKGKKRPPYWCSDVVGFENEWRYYVADGKVLCGEWYYGDEEKCPNAPNIDIDIPKGFCGAIDMGMVDDKLTLVEVNHPFSCGWYGKDHGLYVEFLVCGWKSLIAE